MRVLITGTTGLVGSQLLELILENTQIKEIVSLSRKPLDIQHPKLISIQGDLLDFPSFQVEGDFDVGYCCIGTTQKKTPDLKLYEAIDYGIPLSMGKFLKAHNCQTYCVVSSNGANAESRFFYNRIKGKMEEDVLQLNIENTFLLEPNLIEGPRKEYRMGEKFARVLMKILNPILIGPLAKIKSTSSISIARTMLLLSLKPEVHPKGKIKPDAILRLSEEL